MQQLSGGRIWIVRSPFPSSPPVFLFLTKTRLNNGLHCLRHLRHSLASQQGMPLTRLHHVHAFETGQQRLRQPFARHTIPESTTHGSLILLPVHRAGSSDHVALQQPSAGHPCVGRSPFPPVFPFLTKTHLNNGLLCLNIHLHPSRACLSLVFATYMPSTLVSSDLDDLWEYVPSPQAQHTLLSSSFQSIERGRQATLLCIATAERRSYMDCHSFPSSPLQVPV